MNELAALQCIRSVFRQFDELQQLLHELERRTQTHFEPGEPAHETALLKVPMNMMRLQLCISSPNAALAPAASRCASRPPLQYVVASVCDVGPHFLSGKDWEDIGFQGERPSRDFRAMGMLSLDCLVSFAEVCSHAFAAGALCSPNRRSSSALLVWRSRSRPITVKGH